MMILMLTETLRDSMSNMLIYNDYYWKILNRYFEYGIPSSILFALILFVFIWVALFNYNRIQNEEQYITPSMAHACDEISCFVQGIFGRNDSNESQFIRYPEVIENQKENTVPGDKFNELVFMLDRYGNILYANEKTLLEFRSNLSEILGESIFQIYRQLGCDEMDWFEKLKTHNHSSSLLKIKVDDNDRWYYINYRSNFDSKGELETIIASGNDVSFLIHSDLIKELYSDKDQLTGLFNQYGMFEQMKNFKNVNTAVAFFIEALHFSQITNYYGHELANKLLNAIVLDIKNLVSENCLVVRYTESKFVILCTNCEIHEEALQEHLSKLSIFATTSYAVGNLNLQIDKRIGYAVYPDDTDDFEELISLASIALKESVAKSSYEIVRFDNTMKESLKYNVEIANKLKLALDEELIEVHFQKAVNCVSHEVFVIEELSRWNDSDLGFIPPNEFFRIAKETHQLNRLDRYMVKKTLESFKKLRAKEQYKNAKVTINISPNTLLDINFFDYFNLLVEEYKITPNDIYIEISETTFVNNIDICLVRINQYKNQGYLIALDDFGVEYSSLSILESVDFDIIKIDAHFVQNIDKFSNQEIIKMIRKITSQNCKEIVAEGVETAEQSQALQSLGCEIQQGYYHHRPENLLLY
ncbi:MAG: EAL domain-containing protein [Bacilli bacterium]|nr:EAL domain-containing protein [Bacilli bacterium]